MDRRRFDKDFLNLSLNLTYGKYISPTIYDILYDIYMINIMIFYMIGADNKINIIGDKKVMQGFPLTCALANVRNEDRSTSPSRPQITPIKT